MKPVLYTPKNFKVHQIINCMGYVELDASDTNEGWLGLFPNGTSNLTIALNQDPVEFNKDKGGAILNVSSYASAAIKKTIPLSFINLQFKPFGLYCLKGIPMNELYNSSVPLDLFFLKSDWDDLIDRIHNASSLKHKFMELEKFLSQYIDPMLIDDRINFAIGLIKRSSSPTIDSISGDVCLSSRRFRELFQERTGFSPVFYKKMIRFYRASRQIMKQPDCSLTQIAIENGYYDQAHFIKDFKLFGGITPSQYLKHKSTTSDFYNFILPDLSNFTARS